MRLPSALLALYSIVSSPTLSQNPSLKNHTILNFDTLPMALRLVPPPSPYHHLEFSSFSVFAPGSPLLKDLITPNDLNCAVSLPNALLGSRPSEHASGAFFEIANASAMAAEGLHPYFTLHSLQLKPMDAPEPGTKVWIKGYRRAQESPLSWDVDFPSGYHLPLLVEMQKFSKQTWDGLYKVEMGADFGYDGLDWEFCTDDLDLEFFESPDNGEGTKMIGQKALWFG